MFWKNKVVWVTGASSGIGEALVKQLTPLGARIVLSSRDQASLNRVCNEAGLTGSDSLVLPLDLGEYNGLESAANQVLEKFGRIDVLINNAGFTQRSMARDTGIDVDERLIAVNYFGPVALTKAVLPAMLKQGGGHIAVTSSVAGKLSTPLRSGYCASKHALHGFYESLRAEMYDRNIVVTIAVPGFIRTDISKHAVTGDGSPWNRSDEAQEKGISAEVCASRYLKAIEAGTEEVVIAGGRERLALFLKRFAPGLLRRMVRNTKVT